MACVAVLGTGAMGSRMAGALLRAGHAVTVWNRSADKVDTLVAAGALAAATPREAVSRVEFAICMVRDDAASRSVWLDAEDGALASLPAGAVAIESSTLGLAWVGELATRSQARGLAFLDAPVAGSRPQAEAAQLIYFVGGEVGVLARAEPLLKSMGSAVYHAGPIGSGAAVKLAVNALFGIQVAAMGELIGLLRRSGVDEATAIAIIGSTPVCSPAAKAAAGAMLTRSFAPMFPIGLVEKDFACAVSSAKAKGAPVPLVQTGHGVFAEAMRRGFSADNIAGVVQNYL